MVNERASRTFPVCNDGQVPLKLQWAVPHPFAISPANLSLQPGETQHLTVTLVPEDASVHVSRATCTVNHPEAPVYTIKFSAIGMGLSLTPRKWNSLAKSFYIFSASHRHASPTGKYPHFCVSLPLLEFGEVLVGDQVTKSFTLFNRSPVLSSFELVAVENPPEQVFSFSRRSGQLEPESSMNIKVKRIPVPVLYECHFFPHGQVSFVAQMCLHRCGCLCPCVYTCVRIYVCALGALLMWKVCFVSGLPAVVFMQVTYTPHSAGLFDSDHFQIVSPGGQPVSLHCTGTPLGPSIRLSDCSLNFGEFNMNEK